MYTTLLTNINHECKGKYTTFSIIIYSIKLLIQNSEEPTAIVILKTYRAMILVKLITKLVTSR